MEYFTNVTALAALAVVGVQTILKLKVVPIGFANRYPVPTLIILSIAAAIISVLRTPLVADSWTDWVLLVCTIGVVAAITYNMTLRNWTQLKEIEGEK
jgi:hypothetical protein